MKRLILIFSVLLSVFAYADQERPVRVFVDIVGDLFHAGHIQFLKQARAEGDYLIVGIHEDEAVTDYKRKPILSMEERRIAVEACRYADEVIIDTPIGVTREWIEKYDIDLVVHGDDFTDMKKIMDHYGVPVEMGIFRTVPYTRGISTTDIINRIRSRESF